MRDDFSEATKRVIAARVAHRCSRPDCRAPTAGPRLDPAKVLSVGVAAHITAASELGPRFDSTVSVEERKSIENAIWLCQNCAKLVDNDADRFTVNLLREWKAIAERFALFEVGKTAPSDAADAGEILAMLKKFQPDVAAEFLFRQGYEALQSTDPNIAFDVAVEENGITVTMTSKDGEPISVAFDPVFPDTDAGRRKALEFASFLEFGTAVELDETNVPLDVLPEALRTPAHSREGPYRMRLGPRRPGVLAAALIFRNADGQSYEFPYIEFRSNRFELPDVVLSNAQQRLPFHVELRLRKDKSADFTWSFNFARKGFWWVRESLRFRRVLAKPVAIIVRDLDDGTEHLAAVINTACSEGEVSAQFEAFVERILVVQNRTRCPILVPTREFPTELDERALSFIEHILEKGCQDSPPACIGVTVFAPDGRSQLQELVDGRRPFHGSQPGFETLLGNHVPLGPMQFFCRRVQAHSDDRDKLDQLLAGHEVAYPLQVRFIASEGEIIETRYIAWYPSGRD